VPLRGAIGAVASTARANLEVAVARLLPITDAGECTVAPSPAIPTWPRRAVAIAAAVAAAVDQSHTTLQRATSGELPCRRHHEFVRIRPWKSGVRSRSRAPVVELKSVGDGLE
jgi:hypothetical protein